MAEVATTATATTSKQPIIQSRRSLYVGGLAEDVTETTIRAAMIPFGPIKSLDMPMDYEKGKHKGFCFIEYEYSEDANEAIYNMDGSELCGKTLHVNLAQPNQQMKLGGFKAVWSTDEWFKEQAGIEGEEEAKKKQLEAQDESALKEKAPMPSSN